jgi:hypothetical protein
VNHNNNHYVTVTGQTDAGFGVVLRHNNGTLINPQTTTSTLNIMVVYQRTIVLNQRVSVLGNALTTLST